MIIEYMNDEQLNCCIKNLEHAKTNRQGGLLVTEQKTLDDLTTERDFRDKFDGYVAKAKELINDDIKNKTVDDTVTAFEDLHDFVDANEYLIDAMPNVEVNIENIENYFNRLADAIDDWLKGGRS